MRKNRGKKLTDFPKYETNPFTNIELLKKSFKTFKTPPALKVGEVIVDSDGVISTDKILTFQKYYVQDTAKFIKIFTNEHTADWFNFSKSTSKLLCYIMFNCLVRDKDVFILDYKDAAKKMGDKAYNGAFNGIRDLLENKVILRGDGPNLYFINPHLIFYGSRVKYVKNMEKVSLSVKRELPEISYE
jgi:hypothetical protein